MVQIFSLSAEKAVNVAVLMSSQTHVVDIGVRTVSFRQGDRVIPKAEVIDAVGAFGNSKKGFAVNTFNAHGKNVPAVPVKRSGIKGCMDALTLHQERIGFFVEVITPEDRCMGSRQDRIFITGINAVADLLRGVRMGN